MRQSSVGLVLLAALGLPVLLLVFLAPMLIGILSLVIFCLVLKLVWKVGKSVFWTLLAAGCLLVLLF